MKTTNKKTKRVNRRTVSSQEKNAVQTNQSRIPNTAQIAGATQFQAQIDQSPRVKQFAVLQKMMDESPRMAAQQKRNALISDAKDGAAQLSEEVVQANGFELIPDEIFILIIERMKNSAILNLAKGSNPDMVNRIVNALHRIFGVAFRAIQNYYQRFVANPNDPTLNTDEAWDLIDRFEEIRNVYGPILSMAVSLKLDINQHLSRFAAMCNYVMHFRKKLEDLAPRDANILFEYIGHHNATDDSDDDRGGFNPGYNSFEYSSE